MSRTKKEECTKELKSWRLERHHSLSFSPLLLIQNGRKLFLKFFIPKKTRFLGQSIILVKVSKNLRAEILTIILLVFGRNDVFIKSFRFLLTFRGGLFWKRSEKHPHFSS
jgi:hypothetical protein